MSRQSLGQRRAANAYAAVARAPDATLEIARRLPAMLQTNGLLATWAFLLSKDAGTEPLAALLTHLRSMSHLGVTGRGPEKVFLGWVGGNGDAPAVTGEALRRITEEALEYAGWLKRAAEAASLGQGADADGVSDA